MGGRNGFFLLLLHIVGGIVIILKDKQELESEILSLHGSAREKTIKEKNG